MGPHWKGLGNDLEGYELRKKDTFSCIGSGRKAGGKDPHYRLDTVIDCAPQMQDMGSKR